MRRRKIASILVGIMLFVYLFPSAVVAEEKANTSKEKTPTQFDNVIHSSLTYLKDNQNEDGTWKSSNNVSNTADIANSLEYEYGYIQNNKNLNYMLSDASDYYYSKPLHNNDDISKYLMLDDIREEKLINKLTEAQNPDGGFGLKNEYASDIIDTKLALKALEDLGETDSMIKAAEYMISQLNEDGGFSYQPELQSNPEMTAEIANILADCSKDNQELALVLEVPIEKLSKYLDEQKVSVKELKSDNLSMVYQNLYTALFQLKIDGKYDVKPYYELQGEDGGVFDDPMATALYLELIVREQNSLIAKLDHILITNDQGYAVSAFNADENVNFEIGNEYETEKADLKVTLETPSGEQIPIDTDKLSWNTSDSEEGTYTVKAEIIRKSNEETVTSMTQTFRIEHKLAIDSISLALGQTFARVGDDAQVAIMAKVNLKNYSEEKNDLQIRWTVKCDDSMIQSDERKLTEDDLIADTINLGDFKPDTKDKKTYLITAEILTKDMTLAQSTTNFFVSDKGIAVLRDVNKDYLYESEDNAEITAKIRDERVVDLIFTTSSDDTKLITKYAEQMETIKSQLESLGYIVNLCSVSTSYLSAQDTFAWQEYDHLNYSDYYVSSIPRHIIYDGSDIKMLGYGYAPMKDFLLVPDQNESQKILEFDLQRDQSNDWHTLDGGGFLFNTSIVDNKLQGYCVLVSQNGLNLIQITGVNLDSFRNGGYETVGYAGRTLQTFGIGNVLDKHHIKLIADNNTLSLWNGDEQLLDNYQLPVNNYGNGYGPITSYLSHSCWVRSSFTFSNITMKTIKGEKLADILENYNFESQGSRYVINLSDKSMDSLDTDDEVNDIAQKIVDKNIKFVGIGNETNVDQYKKLMDTIQTHGNYYGMSDSTSDKAMMDDIINEEESKRVKVADDIVGTNLKLSGTFYNGEKYEKSIDQLCAGETLEVKIPTELKGLTCNTDATVIKDMTLSYTDENGVNRVKQLEDIVLPVLAPTGKIKNNVTTNKPEYTQYQNVQIFDRIHNTSKDRTAKDLTNVITILDKDGTVVNTYSKKLSEIPSCGFVERKENWNTADVEEGIYTVQSDVYDKDRLVSQSSAKITVKKLEQLSLKLKGDISLSGKIFKAADTIDMKGSIQNIGSTDINNAKTLIQIVEGKSGNVVYEHETEFKLGLKDQWDETLTVNPQKEFKTKKSGPYVVKYEVVTEDGREIPICQNGFLLDQNMADIIGNNVLYSLNTNADHRGILMSGWKVTVNGGVHSNTDIESNCSILTVTDRCECIGTPIFNTWQTHLNKGKDKAEIVDVPDLIETIKERTMNQDIIANGGYVDKNDNQIRIYGNNVTLSDEIYSDKSIVIDPQQLNTDNDEGIMITSNQDITIRSSNVDFKGIIYAPNGTVTLESANFKLKGRIIAKNIIYQGSEFTGESYKGDVELFER